MPRTFDIDDDLVSRAQAGDPDAMSDLLSAVRPGVLRLAQRMLRTYHSGAELAEDVTQETCVSIYQALPRFETGRAPFGAFVYRVATNKVRDMQRRVSSGFERMVDHDETVLDPDPAAGPEHLALVRADQAAVLALVARLPEKMAQVLVLGAEGYDAAEVGAALGLTRAAVRIRQHRARRMLADILATEVVLTSS